VEGISLIHFLKRAGLFALLLLICSVSSAAAVETLTFQTVLAESLANSFDSRINDENIQSSRAAVLESKADYYPQLTLRFGQEYVHVYDQNSAVASVGDTVYSDYQSKYKHSLSLYAQYNLYDFGRRRLSVQYADQQVTLAELQKDQSRFDNSRKLLELYSQALKLQKQIAGQRNILSGRKRIFELTQQLQKAGKYGQQVVADAAIFLAQTVSKLDQLQIDFQATLDSLSFYTRQTYIADTISLADFALVDGPDDGDISVFQLPEIKILQQQVERKETELAIAKRELLPRLTLQGSYGMYGSDDNSYSDSLEHMRKRDAGVTLALVMPLFDGFAVSAKKQRLQHEIARLKLEKEKALANLDNIINAARRSFDSLQSRKNERSLQKRRIDQQIDDYDRLSEQQLTDQVTLVQKSIELEQHHLDNDLQEVDSAAAAILLTFLQEAGS
jgi:outer membrane protein, adhesin transport system